MSERSIAAYDASQRFKTSDADMEYRDLVSGGQK
jgi:hypothetical protein